MSCGGSGFDRSCRTGEIFARVAVLEIMPSNHCDQLALHIAVAVDVPLSCLDRPVTGEQLDISQRTTGLVHEPRCPGDERPPSECDEQPCRPMLRNARLNQTTMLNGVIGPPRSDRMTGPMLVDEPAVGGEGCAKIGVHWDQSAAAVLGRGIAQLDHRPDVAGWIDHHVPGQVGDLTGPQASLGGQQDDHTVTEGMSGAAWQRPGGR